MYVNGETGLCWSLYAKGKGKNFTLDRPVQSWKPCLIVFVKHFLRYDFRQHH